MTKTTHELRLHNLARITKLIPRKYLARESELMPRKWPAYRFLSPIDATKLFLDAYIAGYKTYYRTNIDREMAERLRVGGKLNWRTQNSHLTQLFSARQKADRIGLPYPAYMEFAFEFASRRKRSHAPQPNQLWPDEKKWDAWSAMFIKFWDADNYNNELNRMEPIPQYSIDFDLGLPAQQRFREELLRLGLRGEISIRSFVASRVVGYRQLDVHDCLPLGEDSVARAEREAWEDVKDGVLSVHEYEQPETEAFYQSCFGVPSVDTTDELICGRCPHIAKCEHARKEVLAKVKADTGSSEPVEDERKRKGRERVARHRARKKLDAQSGAASKDSQSRFM